MQATTIPEGQKNWPRVKTLTDEIMRVTRGPYLQVTKLGYPDSITVLWMSVSVLTELSNVHYHSHYYHYHNHYFYFYLCTSVSTKDSLWGHDLRTHAVECKHRTKGFTCEQHTCNCDPPATSAARHDQSHLEPTMPR